MGSGMGELDRGGDREGITNAYHNIRLAQSGLDGLLKGKRELRELEQSGNGWRRPGNS